MAATMAKSRSKGKSGTHARREAVEAAAEQQFKKNRGDIQHVLKHGRAKDIRRRLRAVGKSDLFCDLFEIARETRHPALIEATKVIRQLGLAGSDWQQQLAQRPEAETADGRRKSARIKLIRQQLMSGELIQVVATKVAGAGGRGRRLRRAGKKFATRSRATRYRSNCWRWRAAPIGSRLTRRRWGFLAKSLGNFIRGTPAACRLSNCDAPSIGQGLDASRSNAWTPLCRRLARSDRRQKRGESSPQNPPYFCFDLWHQTRHQQRSMAKRSWHSQRPISI